MPKARSAAARKQRKSPWCSRCERAIYVPKGWSKGSATRRHYWAKHPEVMRGDAGEQR